MRFAIVSAPLRNAEGGAIRIKQAVHAQGRESATRFRLGAVLPDACLVRAVPVTGRTHQIRAHAALLGHPVVGDKLYGASEEAFLRWVGEERRGSAGRQLLHSTSLAFPHPSTGEGMTLTVDDAGLVQQYLCEPGRLKSSWGRRHLGTAPSRPHGCQSCRKRTRSSLHPAKTRVSIREIPS